MNTSIGLFYGSTTGMTETIAKKIEEVATAAELSIDLHEVSFTEEIETLYQYHFLILGSPTWFYGEHQDDWEELLDKIPEDADFSHMTIALYGLGDQEGYPEYYLDAMGMIADEFERRGASIIGLWPNDESYDFAESKALRGDYFVGLALDEDGQTELTEERLMSWLAQVLPELTV